LLRQQSKLVEKIIQLYLMQCQFIIFY